MQTTPYLRILFIFLCSFLVFSQSVFAESRDDLCFSSDSFIPGQPFLDADFCFISLPDTGELFKEELESEPDPILEVD